MFPCSDLYLFAFSLLWLLWLLCVAFFLERIYFIIILVLWSWWTARMRMGWERGVTWQVLRGLDIPFKLLGGAVPVGILAPDDKEGKAICFQLKAHFPGLVVLPFRFRNYISFPILSNPCAEQIAPKCSYRSIIQYYLLSPKLRGAVHKETTSSQLQKARFLLFSLPPFLLPSSHKL